jgi:hypothetical protein
MNRNIDCEAFQDRLDRLGGRSPEDMELAELGGHVERCPDCAMMLDAYMHLAGPSNEELGAQAPDGMISAMWHDVAERTIGRSGARGPGRFSLMRMLVPTLAAAVVVLVFAFGFMLGELRHLRGMESRMAAELERRDATIAVLQLGRDDTPGLLASERFRSLARRRFLQDRDEYRVSELIALLGQLPPDTKLLSAREVNALIGGSGGSSLSPYSTQLRRFDYSNGLDAREAIMLIEILGIDPDELVPRERLAALNGI